MTIRSKRSGSYEKRTTGRTWQNIRKQVLSDNPLCVHCQLEGRTTLANEVDHILALAKGGTDDYANLQGLCFMHHNKKSIEERGLIYKEKITIGLDGWPIDKV
jgi:5-methylcytosine-specific restriction protein A